MKKSLLILSIIFVFVLNTTFSWAGDGQASNEELMREIKALKARVAELESKLFSRQQEAEKRDEAKGKFEHIDTHILHEEGGGIEIDGFKIGVGSTFIGQCALNANNSSGDEEVADGTYSVDIEIERSIGENGVAFLHLEGGQGAGLDGDEIATFSTVNRDVLDSGTDVDITELWYEHVFFDGKALCTAGKLDPTVYLDTNEIANDETSQFISTTFRNSTALEFPDDNTYGFRTALIPTEWAEINLGIFDDNADWEDVYENIFYFVQLNLKLNLLDMPGNYRVYGWFDDSDHTKWVDPGTITQQNFGFGTSCDQKISDCLTLFGRFGWQDPDVATVEWAWSTGFQLDGVVWGREKDYLGCAIGMDVPSDDYGDAGNPDEAEGHLEAYYNIHINEYLHISPDAQLIWNANGEDEIITVLGARGQIDF